MQEVTPWPDSFDVSEPVGRVVVDGKLVAVESVTVASELDTAAPEMVAAGGGSIVAATGTASIVARSEVAESGYNPWGDAESLVSASEIVVEAGYRDPVTGGVGCARQITGHVDSLSGGALSPSVNMDFVDFATAFDRDITLEPLMQQYPNRVDGGPRMGAGLSALYVTNRVVRHCGFYSTPPMLDQAVVSVPLFGSGVAERGVLVAGAASAGSQSSAGFQPTPWGLGLAEGLLSYAPDYGARGHARLTSTLHVSFMRAGRRDGASGDARINLQWGSWQDAIHVQAQRNGTVIVRYRSGGTVTTVATLAAQHVADSEVFTVLVRPSGETTIYASNGASASGSMSLPSRVTSHSMDEVIVEVPSDAPRLGGVQVAFSPSRVEGFQPTAHFQAADYTSIVAFPAQINKNCMTLLKEQAEAELTAMWVDEYGHFRWADRTQLRWSTPRGTLTSHQDLLDLQWSLPVRSVFSRVVVEHDAPRITRRTEASVTVSDSRGTRLSSGDEEYRFVEPPGDEDWHFVEPPQWLGGTIDSFQLKRGRGSYVGGVIVDEDDNDGRLAYSTNLTHQWEQIHPQKWLLTLAARNLGGTEFIEQRFRDRPDLYGNFSEEPLPLIRARGLVQWESEALTGAARGPAYAPVFTHQAGPWVQNTNSLRTLADFLADQLTQPDVLLRDVPIVPDPRIQLGDTFWLEDQSTYSIRLRVVVMGKTLTYETTSNGVEMSQRITCKVIQAQRLKVTYQDLQDAWETLPYQDFQTAWAGADYAALEANPLERK